MRCWNQSSPAAQWSGRTARTKNWRPAESTPNPPHPRRRPLAPAGLGDRLGATYRACKPENRQRRSSSFAAMAFRARVRGLCLDGRGFPGLLWLRRLGCHRLQCPLPRVRRAGRDRCPLRAPRPRRSRLLRGAHAGCVRAPGALGERGKGGRKGWVGGGAPSSCSRRPAGRLPTSRTDSGL